MRDNDTYKRSLVGRFFITGLLLLAGTPAAAQQGSVTGRISDGAGRPINGARLERRRMAQTELQARSGLGYSTINALYHGKTERIEFATLDRLCDILKWEVGEILDYDPTRRVADHSRVRRDRIGPLHMPMGYLLFRSMDCNCGRPAARDAGQGQEFPSAIPRRCFLRVASAPPRGHVLSRVFLSVS